LRGAVGPGEGMARPALLIGIGNPLRGDDGVGGRLVEELAEELGGWSTPSAELRVVQQLTPELACTVAGAQRVLFVDACVSAGTGVPWLDVLQPDTCAGATAAGLPSHQLEPAALLALAHTLYGWRGEGTLLRLPAFAFPHGQALSAPLLEALPAARRLVRWWLQG
jgi:hydrogenase maturation protease